MKEKRVFAIFIAYNAANTIENFYNSFPKHLVDEIILVDDASTDGTYELAKKLGITSWRNPVNLGYGGNIKRAVEIALEKGADIIVDMHPDGEYSPSAMPSALKEVESGSEFILGNRFTSIKNLLRSGMYPWKLIPILILNKFDRLILGIKINDLHQGFRVYTRNMLEKINFKANSNKYIFGFELLAQAAYNNIKIAQVPVQTNYTGKKRGASFKNSFFYTIGTFRVLFLFILAKLFYKSSIFRKPGK
ncbi:MAG: glycosyltransferase family 2 protein [bacterium]|nr:glycosyltransferase family 2 protein [bacterium]